MEPIKLNSKEKFVCKILYFAMNNRKGLCDPTNFSDEDEKVILELEEKGYLKNDVNCIILTKKFKEFIEEEFGGNEDVG